mgnify:FL=1
MGSSTELLTRRVAPLVFSPSGDFGTPSGDLGASAGEVGTAAGELGTASGELGTLFGKLSTDLTLPYPLCDAMP